ncbi:MAG: DUF11 domain-containing protein [Candidatus Dormibacteraeota bacterium]|nr:DUF11 domain-containing protein [Candidatus Dormibacteraeota bacterium]
MVLRRPALLAAAPLLLAPLLVALAGCGSGSGQLTVSLTGEHTGAAYDPTKSSTYPQYAPGDEATFTVHVVNNGPGAVTGVTVHVTLPDTFRYHATTGLSAPGATRTQPIDAAVNSTTPIFGLWTLAPPGAAGAGVATSVNVTFTADVAGQPGGVVVQAFAAGDTNAGQTTTAAYNVILNPAASVSALASASPSAVKRGGTVTYQVRILNGGTGPAHNVGVLITLPPVMAFAGSVTPFSGNGTRNRGVDPIKNTLEVYYDGFTLPPLSNAGPGYVVIVFKVTVLGGGRSFNTPRPAATPTPAPAPSESGSVTGNPGTAAGLPSSAPSTVPPGTYTLDASITDTEGDTFTLHAVAPVAVS